jgi:hypothetical protein
LEPGDWARSRPPLFSTRKEDVTKAECLADGLHDGCFCLNKVGMPWCCHVSSSQKDKCSTWWFSVGSMVRKWQICQCFLNVNGKAGQQCDLVEMWCAYLGQVHHSQIRPVWGPYWCWVGT